MKKSGLAGFLTFCLFTTSANAGLIGDNVGIDLNIGGLPDTGVISHIAGAGEEGSFYDSQFYDFGNFSFAIRAASLFCGFTCVDAPITLELSDLDFGATLTNVLLSTNLTGVDVVFGADFVTFSWTDQLLPPNTYLSAVFETITVSAPEPATIGLLGLGLLAIGHSRQKHRANAS